MGSFRCVPRAPAAVDLRRDARLMGAIAAMLALCALLLAGCGERAAPSIEIEGPTMGTYYSVKVARPPLGMTKDALKREVESVLDRVIAEISTYEPTSELSRLNANPAHGLDPHLARAVCRDRRRPAHRCPERRRLRYHGRPLGQPLGFRTRGTTGRAADPRADSGRAGTRRLAQAGAARLPAGHPQGPRRCLHRSLRARGRGRCRPGRGGSRCAGRGRLHGCGGRHHPREGAQSQGPTLGDRDRGAAAGSARRSSDRPGLRPGHLDLGRLSQLLCEGRQTLFARDRPRDGCSDRAQSGVGDGGGRARDRRRRICHRLHGARRAARGRRSPSRRGLQPISSSATAMRCAVSQARHSRRISPDRPRKSAQPAHRSSPSDLDIHALPNQGDRRRSPSRRHGVASRPWPR